MASGRHVVAGPARSRSATAARGTGTAAAPLADLSPHGERLRAMAELAADGPATVAQRRRLGGLFPPPAPRPPTDSPAQFMLLFRQGKTVRVPGAKDSKERIFESRDLVGPKRVELRDLLKGNDLLPKIEAEWAEADKAAEKAPPADLDSLFVIAAALTALEGAPQPLSKVHTEQLAVIMAKLRRPAPEPKEGEEDQARTLRDTLHVLLARAVALWKKPHDDSVKLDDLPQGGIVIEADDITGGEIDAYRTDIGTGGAWGGLAEAEVAALNLGVQTDIFNLDAAGNYRRVIQVGAGAANVNNWALLHRGDHYEVVAGAVDGAAFAPANIQEETRPYGDCLFEALIILSQGQKPDDDTMDGLVATLREGTAIGLTDEQIRTSLLHILIHGETQGLGEGTRRIVEARGADPEAMTKAMTGVAGSKDMLAEYKRAYTADPASPDTAAMLRKLRDQRLKAMSKGSKLAAFRDLQTDHDAGLYSFTESQVGTAKIRYDGAAKDFAAKMSATPEEALNQGLAGMTLSGSSSSGNARHDFQPTGSTNHNLQIQLGGAADFRRGKGDTSITLVVVEVALWDAMVAQDQARWLQVLEAAHRRSFANTSRIDLRVAPPKDAKEDAKKPAKKPGGPGSKKR